MPERLTVLVAAKLHPNQLERHLELFEYIEEVERVLVVRNAPAGERLSKVENHTFAPGSRPVEALRMVKKVRSLIRAERVDWVVGFNPVPWGSLAFSAARAQRIPTCLSLIGMDFLQLQTKWGFPFLQAVRRAQAVTVTGERMVEGLIALGVERQRIRILPHSVDLLRFRPTGGQKRYDVLSVGQLIDRKRMDVVINAVALSRKRGRDVRLGILGKGPLEGALHAQAKSLGVSDLVEFIGYRNDVEAVLGSARSFCLASEWEGVPFALMEAMAAGLVPVVTDVGTISDWIRTGENGCLVPVGDASALASAWERLFSDDGRELEGLRQRILAERNSLGFFAGATVWRDILGLARPT